MAPNVCPVDRLTAFHYFLPTPHIPGTYAPYQIQLDDGRLIFAPRDEDEIIRLDQNAAPGSGGGGAAAADDASTRNAKKETLENGAGDRAGGGGGSEA